MISIFVDPTGTTKIKQMKHFQLWITQLLILLVAYACTSSDSKNTESKNQNKENQQTPENQRNVPGVSMPRGLISNTDRATPGYILFSSIVSDETYLINLDGEVVKIWNNDLAGGGLPFG